MGRSPEGTGGGGPSRPGDRGAARAVAVLTALAMAATLLVGAVALGDHGGDHFEVAITDTGYEPEFVSLLAGDSITWTNVGLLPHSASADDGSFDSGPLVRGESFSFTFADPGFFTYTSTVTPLDSRRFHGAVEVSERPGVCPVPEPAPTASPEPTDSPVPEPSPTEIPGSPEPSPTLEPSPSYCPTPEPEPEPPPLPPSPPDVTYTGEELPLGHVDSFYDLGGGFAPPLLVRAGADASRGAGRYSLRSEAWSRNPVGRPEAGAFGVQPIPHYVRDGDGWIRVTAVLRRVGEETLGSTLSAERPALRSFRASLFASQGFRCVLYHDPEFDGPEACDDFGGGDSTTDEAEASGGELEPRTRELRETFALDFAAYVRGGRPVFLSIDLSQYVRATGIAEALIDHRLTIESVRIRSISDPITRGGLAVVVICGCRPILPLPVS